MTENKEQEAVDITIKRGVDIRYDNELGLTGRSAHIVICRLAEALERRDALITHMRLILGSVENRPEIASYPDKDFERVEGPNGTTAYRNRITGKTFINPNM